MGLIECIDCGKKISDRIENCPHCGCPVAVSMENEEKVEKKQSSDKKNVFKFDYDKTINDLVINPVEEKEKLIQIIEPMIKNKNDAERVSINLGKYLEKYETILSHHARDIIKDTISGVIDRIIRQRDYIKEQNRFKGQVAAATYKKQMSNISTPGMGFSVITSDPISAAVFSAMNTSEINKQYNRQTRIINNMLIKNLSEIHYENGLSSSELNSVLIAIDDSIRLAIELVELKKKIIKNLCVYEEKEKYDTKITIGECKIYELLSSVFEKQDFIGTYQYKEQDLFIEIEGAGYVRTYSYRSGRNQYMHYYWVSTGKYEEDIIRAMYNKEHPEEIKKQEALDLQKDVELYESAKKLLEEDKYYEAATRFGQCYKYKDAFSQSLKIWQKKILKDELFQKGIGSFIAIGLDGKIQENTEYLSSGEVRINEHREERLSWEGLKQLARYGRCALGYDGKIRNNINGAGRDWKQVISISSNFPTLAALHKNGLVSACGYNENGACNVSEWKDVIKIETERENVAALTKEGRVLVAGKINTESIEYREWTDIIDIKLGDDCVVGLKKNGTVVACGNNKYGQCDTSEWKNVVRINCFGADTVGITADGKGYIVGWQKKFAPVMASWESIIDVRIEQEKLVGLKADGTMVTFRTRANLEDWKDIVAFEIDNDTVFGITKEGKILVEGLDEDGLQQQVTEMRLFTDINTLDEDRAKLIEKLYNIKKDEIVVKEKELSEIKGLFTGKKKALLSADIEDAMVELEMLEYYRDNY